MIALLLSPIGRFLAAAGLVLALAAGAYFKIQSDALKQAEAAATLDALKRTENAISSSDALRNDPERLREMDERFCRDC